MPAQSFAQRGGTRNERSVFCSVVVLVEGVAMIIDKLKAYGAIAAALALAGLLLVQTDRLHKAERAADKAVTQLAKERAEAAQALAIATAQARETEQQLAADADKIKEETHAQITALSGRAAALASRLRNAQANAATARLVSKTAHHPGAPEAAGVCDSGRLPERTGDDLIALASRAETIRIQLASCEESYERARGALSR